MARMNRPAPVEVSYRHMRFLITHNPSNATLSTFIEVSGPSGPGGCPAQLRVRWVLTIRWLSWRAVSIRASGNGHCLVCGCPDPGRP